MRARVIKPFIDKQEGVARSPGDTFTVSAERLAEINSTKFGILAVEVAAPKKKPKKG